MPLSPYADLLIRLIKLYELTYRVELWFDRPDESTGQPPVIGQVTIDDEQLTYLRSKALMPRDYGRSLTNILLKDQALKDAFSGWIAAAKLGKIDLHLRLLIDPSAADLNDLRWETLRNVEDQYALATDANLPISRFLYSTDPGTYELRPRGRLQALIVCANPRELETGLELGGHRLDKVEVRDEVERANDSLQKKVLKVEICESRPDEPGRATFDNIKARLRKGYDILYLVCHGAVLPGDDERPVPFILLEKEDGSYDRRDARELAAFIRHLPARLRPRLVILVSCQSAGQGVISDLNRKSYDRGMLAALGPLLVDAGIPAVVAMQHNITMKTIRQFTPAFLEALIENPEVNGQVDLAMAIARNQIQERPDWWVPVLYSRLKGGRLWHGSQLVGNKSDDDLFPVLARNVADEGCVPILGMGLLESLIGDTEEIARTWADAHKYPLEIPGLSELPRVAQYLSRNFQEDYPYGFLMGHLRERLAEACGLDPKGAGKFTLDQLFEAYHKQRSQQEIPDVNWYLARLPFDIYVTASPDDLLERALREPELGKSPHSLYSCWNRRLEKDLEKDVETGTAYREYRDGQVPTPEQPLVFHLFGRYDKPASLVLTEDDYFDYLMWINNKSAPYSIPDVIKTAWSERSLLFLGFRLRDWNFRLLFRSILNEDLNARVSRKRSATVQLIPGDDRRQSERARRYLEKYFTEAIRFFDIYWSNTDEFLYKLMEYHQAIKA